MQILTYTQKLWRQRRFLSTLLPLFALFVGLGASQSALAQTAVTANNITLNVKGTSSTYDTQSTATGAGIFNGTSFGSFSLTTPDVFTLNGTVLTINDPTGNFNAGFLRFRIYQTGTAAPAPTDVALGSGVLSGGVRTFTVTGQNRNLLASLTGGAGTNYTFDVFFKAEDNNSSFTSVTNAPPRSATFTVTGAPVVPSNINNTKVFINPNSSAATGYTVYNANPGTPPSFQGANLGSFNVNTGILNLNGGSADLALSNGDQVGAVRLYYRAFKQGMTLGLPLYQNVALTSGTAGTSSGTYSLTTAQVNLVTQVPQNSGIGNFFVQVYYEADVTPTVGTPRTIRDDNGGNAYTANFILTGVPILTDTWTGSVNDDWFNPNNWDLGRCPDAITNAVVPDFGTGSLSPYPNINAGVTFTTSAGTIANNTASGPALSRSLNLQGSTQAQRTILRLINGRLKVFGDFTNLQNSFIQRTGTTFELAGGNQSFTGGSNFSIVEISGGGTKNLTGTMDINESFTFTATGGVVTTDISRVNTNFIKFADRSTLAPRGAQLVGENEQNYIRGYVTTSRSSVVANELNPDGTQYIRSYSGLGFQPYFKGTNNPGDVEVTRNTAESYTPLFTNNGTTTARYGIRRIFGVRPSSPNTNNGGLLADVYFTYRDGELTGLGPNGTGTVSEPNLGLFVSTSAGNQFGLLGRDALDQVNNKLTKYDVRTFATFTLGDLTAPLPVSLTGINAKRVGNDAVVTWETAMERNNKGFEVQVSTDGKEFRTLGFVASASPNTSMPQSYTYMDVEKNKAGQRYYRLRQVDLDGTATFFGPRLVGFDGKAAEAAMMAYPNPFNGSDNLHLNLQSSVAGNGAITITDMTGRTVSKQVVEVNTGNNDVTVNSLNNLKSGLYLVHMVLPTGEVQNLKVMKQ